MSPAPKFELPIAQEGMVYKIWESVYKIVQNKYKIMIYFSFSKSVLGGGGDMYLVQDLSLACPQSHSAEFRYEQAPTPWLPGLLLTELSAFLPTSNFRTAITEIS